MSHPPLLFSLHALLCICGPGRDEASGRQETLPSAPLYAYADEVASIIRVVNLTGSSLVYAGVVGRSAALALAYNICLGRGTKEVR